MLEIHTANVFENLKTTPLVVTEVPRIPADTLTYDDFFNRYMLPNRPVILTGLASDWECFQHWSGPNQSDVDFEYLRGKFQSLQNDDVPVADCGRSEFNTHVKLDMKFEQFIRYWEDRRSGKRIDEDARLLYLKDWHVRRILPDYKFYVTPLFFGSDWLNEYLVDVGADDYMFVYMGPKDTWTPLHSDVLGSFSWSTNITGIKRWIFLVPGEEHKLSDRLGNLPYTVESTDLVSEDVRHVVIEQAAGETVFVPSGWYHQVSNESDTISVNHNWFNGCNLDEIWRLLKDMLTKVRLEIDDCRDMDDFGGQCQLMLRAGHGMNYDDFFALLEHVARRRMLENGDEKVVVNGFRLGRKHLIFDLEAIRRVLVDFIETDDFSNWYTCLRKKCEELLTCIDSFLDK